MLLCIGGAEINHIILHSVSDFPFSLIGVITGIVGLAMVFKKGKDS